jgi:hypothetical protein
VHLERLPDSIRNSFFDAIRAFPNVQFLWSWSPKLPKDIPNNLYLAKWFSQQDVLGKIKIP